MLSLNRAGFELLGSLKNRFCFRVLSEDWIEGPGVASLDKHLAF